MSDKSSKELEWKASFILSTPVLVGKVTSPKGIEFEIDDKSQKITGINIFTPAMTQFSAINYAEIICNRCVDYLSFVSRLPVSASLRQITEIGVESGIKRGLALFPVDTLFAKRIDVDVTMPAFQRVIQNKDTRLALQLAHFRRGLRTNDVIEKIREFYQVLELEESKVTEKFRYVRHLVSHPELTNKKAVEEATELIGKPYLDPSVPRDLQNLSSDVQKIEKKARAIIQSKLVI